MRSNRIYRRACMLVLMVSAGIVHAQEHSYAPADIEAGQGVYQANCQGCHGDNGEGVDGADLSTGRFRRASSDEDLIRVIRTGITGTPMSSHERLSMGELRTVVAFLRALPAGGGIVRDERDIALGDPVQGETLFYGNAQCSTCHGVNGGGNRLSPDLGSIGAQRSAGSLQDSILVANAEVRAGDRFYRVVTRGGEERIGLLLNQDTHSVQMMNGEERLVAYNKNDLSEHGFTESPMPSYLDVLSEKQVSDLVAYLLTLKGEVQ